MTSYESLKDKFKDFILFREHENPRKVIINVNKFDINKYKDCHSILTQYLLFIILRIQKDYSIETIMHVYMKGVTKSHFFPSYLKKILQPLDSILKDDNTPDLITKAYIYDMGKVGILIWNIIKHLFHKDTIKKIKLIR